MRHVALILAVLLVSQGATRSQLIPGQIAIASFAGNAMNLVSVGGANVQTHQPNTGGEVRAVLWDPTYPNDFIVAGHIWPRAYIARLRFNPLGITVTKHLSEVSMSNPIIDITQMSWEIPGSRLIAVCASTHQVYRVDLGTGNSTAVVTPVTTSSQPWGQNLQCGARDPLSGDVYVGTTDGKVYRIGAAMPIAGAASVNQVVSGLGEAVVGITFDPSNTSSNAHHVIIATDSGIRRINMNSTAGTAEILLQGGAFGTPSAIRSVAVDHLGSYVIGTEGNLIWRVPNPAPGPIQAGGVTATILAAGTLGYYHSSVAVVGGGIPPWTLTVSSFAAIGSGAIVNQNAPSNIGEGWLLVSRTTGFLPAGTGPWFGIWPDSMTLLFLHAYPFASPGNIFHFAGAPPAQFTIPVGVTNAFVGETWDFVMCAFGTSGAFLGTTNVSRVTW